MLGNIIAADLCVNANTEELVGEFVQLLKDNWNHVCRVCFVVLPENRHRFLMLAHIHMIVGGCFTSKLLNCE